MLYEVEPIRNTRDINKIKQYLYGKENKRDYCIFVMGINVGLRAGDLLSLKIKDVTDGKVIYDNVTVKEEKTGKTRTFTLNKNAKEAINVYIPCLDNLNLESYFLISNNAQSIYQLSSSIRTYILYHCLSFFFCLSFYHSHFSNRHICNCSTFL